MGSNGVAGEAPYWYRVVKAAQYLKVPPWELAERPIFWMQAAEEAQAAEYHAEEMKESKKK